MVNRRQRYCHSLGAAIVAGALAITTLAGTTNEAKQGAVTANHGAAADPHAAHKKMVSKNNLRRSFAIYPYQDLTVTDMGGDESTLGDQIGNETHLGLLHLARRHRGSADPDAGSHEGRVPVVGDGVLVDRDPGGLKRCLSLLARRARG